MNIEPFIYKESASVIVFAGCLLLLFFVSSKSTTWTLTKRLEKKLDGNYTRMLRAILNKSWRQHPTRHQLYGHLPPIMKTIQIKRTRHAGHCWRSKDELISDVLLWTPAYGKQKQDDQLEHTFSSYVRIPDVAMNGREKWRERVRDSRASGTTWWWWWWFMKKWNKQTNNQTNKQKTKETSHFGLKASISLPIFSSPQEMELSKKLESECINFHLLLPGWVK